MRGVLGLAWPLARTVDLWQVDPATPNTRSRPLPAWSYLAVAASCGLLLAARAPDQLLSPAFVLEDGTIFFAQAYNLSFWAAITTRYAGYHHLIPRLIAEVAMFFPLASIATFYSLSALTFHALSLSWFYLPIFRPVVQNDWLRLGLVILLVCGPNVEAPALIAYLQWPLAVWGLFVALMPPVRCAWLGWLITLGYGLVVLTAPALLILAPVWLLRAWLARTWQQRLQISVILSFMGVAFALVFTGPSADHLLGGDTTLLIIDGLRAFALRVLLLMVVGWGGADWLLATLGWPGVYVISTLTGLLLLVGLVRTKLWLRSWGLVSVLYVLLVAGVLYITRATYYNFVFAESEVSAPHTLARYFLIPSTAFLLLIAILADQWLAARLQSACRWVIAASFVCLLSLYLVSFRFPSWEGATWQPYARLLAAGEANATADPAFSVTLLDLQKPLPHLAVTETRPRLFLPLVQNGSADLIGKRLLIVPIMPDGWFMELLTPEPRIESYVFPEGVSLIGLRPQLVNHARVLELYWQINGFSMMQPETTYAITVQAAAAPPKVQKLESDHLRWGSVFVTTYLLTNSPDQWQDWPLVQITLAVEQDAARTWRTILLTPVTHEH